MEIGCSNSYSWQCGDSYYERKSLGLVVPGRVDCGALSDAFLLNGALHWVTKRYNNYQYHAGQCSRLSFDLAEEKCGEIERPSCGSLDNCYYHLVVLRGCLSAVHCLDYERLDIWIMKEYAVKVSWSLDFVIGTYLPRRLQEKSSRQGSEVLDTSLCLGSGRSIKAACNLNGEILLEYEREALVCEILIPRIFKDLLILGQPNHFRTIAHAQSLFTVKDILQVYMINCN